MTTTNYTDQLGSAATSITITASSLASSATAGRQSDAVTFIDGTNKTVPQAIDIFLQFELTTGTISGDGTVYLFMAESTDETNYTGGNPAVGASDAAYTFTDSPVGSTPKPTPLILIGAITYNAQSQKLSKTFALYRVPPKAVFVLLNYTGIAGSGSNFLLKYRARSGDGR